MTESTGDISRKKRFILLLIAWVVTAIATIPGTLFVPYLPIGLARVFGGKAMMAPISDWYILFGGWVVYIGLTIAGYFSRRRWIYFIVYFVLCLLLALNCVGCREVMNEIGST